MGILETSSMLGGKASSNPAGNLPDKWRRKESITLLADDAEATPIWDYEFRFYSNTAPWPRRGAMGVGRPGTRLY